MSNHIFEILIEALGPDCISRAPSVLAASTTDYSFIPGGQPLAVFYPKTHDHVVTMMAIAVAYKIAVVPRGAGTGTTGGAVSSDNCIVVDFTHMNQIQEIDTANRVAVVQPGVITGVLQSEVEKHGLFYPPDPASLDTCTLGGNIAENAGGPRAYKYGVTAQYVIGLKGVWGSGAPFNLGGKLIKNVTGYNLISLLVGSEGTLGLITEITLKLIPKPTDSVEFAVGFSSIEHALALLEALSSAGIYPAASEWMDHHCLEAGAAYLNTTPLIFKICLLFELDGQSTHDIQTQLDTLKALAKEHQGAPIDNSLWALRRCLSKALRASAKNKASHDIVVPPSQIGPYLQKLQTLSQETGFTLLGYGHLGDGNIHVNILNKTQSEEAWQTALPHLTQKVFDYAIALGGTLTGEHGIGLTKRHYLPMAIDPASLEIMRTIKKTCDPFGILNLGKGV